MFGFKLRNITKHTGDDLERFGEMILKAELLLPVH